MKNKLIKYGLILLIFTFNSHSDNGLQIEKPIKNIQSKKEQKYKKFIDNSVLIFKGKLIDKYSKIEKYKNYTRIGREGEIVESSIRNNIFTTYIFEVIEVFKGNYNKKTVKVVRKGGCSKSLDKCIVSSWDYDYKQGQIGVMLLNYRYKSKIFQSIGSYSTAYSLQENGSLKSQRIDNFHQNNKNKVIYSKNGKPMIKPNLTIEKLKSLIIEVENFHENY